jgi:23S rRNA (adenine2503-C2)-methyltransferase
MTAMTPQERTNLLGLPRAALEKFVAQLGSKPFRARQLMSWMYKRGVGAFADMTDLAKDLRARLGALAQVAAPEILAVQRSSDGTCKWMLKADASQAFEMVFIPEPDRGTLCISSQVGCALDCSFCSTAQQGFNRNLSTAEIIGQVWLAAREVGRRFPPDHQRGAHGHGGAARQPAQCGAGPRHPAR